MSLVALKKLIEHKDGISSILADLSLTLDEPLTILDMDGNMLFGEEPETTAEKLPITYQDNPVGWVLGKNNLAPIANFLNFLVKQEMEKRSLGAEVLERYRELNMFYSLSENLASSLQMSTIASKALEQASNLSQISDGIIVLIDEENDSLNPAAVHGNTFHQDQVPKSLNSFVNQIVESGRTEILSEPAEELGLFSVDGKKLKLMGAPLKSKDRILGAMILASTRGEQITAGELKVLNSIAFQAAPFIDIVNLSRGAVEKARMERELQMALQVQVDLLPKDVPQVDGWSYAALWRPAREVAGDFFNFFPTKDGMVDLVIADVADKGMPAALFMALTSTALRAYVEGNSSLTDGIAKTNHLVCQESHNGLFVTLFIARINSATGVLECVNAGHNPPLIYHTENDQITSINRTGMSLGLDQYATYEQRIVQLNSNDIVLFYTDGLTEAFDMHNNEFGIERLRELIYDHRNETAEEIKMAIVGAVDNHTANTPISDDLTIVVVKRL